MTSFRNQCVALLLAMTFGLTGCGGEPGTAVTATPTDSAPAGHHPHAHPSKGPHQGDLIELGNEEYHAEILHDQQSVTIYVLNRGATQQVAIDAKEIVINAKDGDQPQQFSLSASPDDTDPPAKSSRFVVTAPDLVQLLERHDSNPRVVLTIAGKSYRGNIVHTH